MRLPTTAEWIGKFPRLEQPAQVCGADQNDGLAVKAVAENGSYRKGDACGGAEDNCRGEGDGVTH